MQFLAPVARELSLLGLYLGKPDHPGESMGVVPSLRKSTLLGTMPCKDCPSLYHDEIGELLCADHHHNEARDHCMMRQEGRVPPATGAPNVVQHVAVTPFLLSCARPVL